LLNRINMFASDMLSIKLETFTQNAAVRRELTKLIVSKLPSLEEMEATNSSNPSKLKDTLQTAVSILAGKILATFELHIAEDAIMNSDYLSPELKAKLLDARSSDEG